MKEIINSSLLNAADIQYNLDILSGKAEYPSSKSSEKRRLTPSDIDKTSLEFLGIFNELINELEESPLTEKTVIPSLKSEHAKVTSYVQGILKQRKSPALLSPHNDPLTWHSTPTIPRVVSSPAISPGMERQNHTPSIQQPEAIALYGLPNEGKNNCFMNAVFQMVMNDAELCRGVEETYKKLAQAESRAGLSSAYKALLDAIDLYKKGQWEDINLSPLRALIRAPENTMEDAEEFLSSLLGQLDLTRYHIGCHQVIERHYQPLDPASDLAKDYTADRLSKMSGKSDPKQECSQKKDPNITAVIHIPIENHQNGQFLLDQMFLLHPADPTPLACTDGWYLPTHERLILEPSPQRLIIALRRFNADRTKNDKQVEMAEEMMIGAQKYRLKTLVIHQGASLEGGHYWAYLNKNGAWSTANDSRVGKTNSEELKEGLRKGYLYFYEKI